MLRCGYEELGIELQMWCPVRGWSTTLEWEGKSPHLHPAPRKLGPNPPFFGAQPPAPGRLAGSSAAPQWGRGAKSGAQ